tara:strand:- start:2116 stop:2337 length:222 start_codon:yes stop_codon:yes gene_type:complete
MIILAFVLGYMCSSRRLIEGECIEDDTKKKPGEKCEKDEDCRKQLNTFTNECSEPNCAALFKKCGTFWWNVIH